MNLWNIQPPALKQNLIQYLAVKIIMDTVLAIYNFMKTRSQRDYNKKILKAQKMQVEAGTGMYRNERRSQILEKYVKFLFLNRAKNQPANPMQMMMQRMQNPQQQQQQQPQQAPQMPGAFDMILRFAPMFILNMLFSDKPAACLYLPFFAKLEKNESTVAALIIKVSQWGRTQNEVWKSGYVSRTFVGFVFGQLYGRLLKKVLYGQQPKLSMMQNIQLQQEVQVVKDKHGPKIDLTKNEDLKTIFGDEIAGLSEIDEKFEKTD